MEKCLTCQCQKKTLVCRLKVCPEMPMPPPRGCIVVQQRNSCCPYLSCARLEAFYKIPATRRIIAYLDHYERESIDRVVNDNMLQRRSDDSEVDMYVCVKNGTVYKSGSAMSSSNLCTYCYCIGGTEKCVKPKCMLPVEGCKPIFVDSTCCPVRYDCTSKPAGKSSQEVRYRKTSNKHYLRMSQRLQRNRGCTVDQQFYVEGQKMRSDPDKPCDICFCIRGTRRCAPKKCSPALKNCIPVVPKGQCCPSSYDCGSQRAQSSRQFNLFSLLFGKEDELNGNDTKRLPPIEYPPDRHPSVTAAVTHHHQNILQKNDEKSILDTIREGLEIIDGNNDEIMISENLADKLQTPLTKVVIEGDDATDASSTQPVAQDAASTEVSFLDLLLGNDEDDGALSTKVTEEGEPDLKTTTTYDGISWVDLLLGPDDDVNKVVGTTTDGNGMGELETTISAQYEPSAEHSIDRVDHDFGGDLSGSGEIVVGAQQTNETVEMPNIKFLGLNGELEKKQESNHNMEYKVTKTNAVSKTNSSTKMSGTKSVENTTAISSKLVESSTSDITKIAERPTASSIKILSSARPRPTIPGKKAYATTTKSTSATTTQTKPSTKLPSKLSAKETPSLSVSTKKPTQKHTQLKFMPKTTYKPKDKLHRTTTSRPLNDTETQLTTKATTQTNVKTPIQSTTNAPPEKKQNGLLTALLDGLSDMLSVDNVRNSTQARVPEKANATASTTTDIDESTQITTTSKTKPPPPSFKPLPILNKPTHMRINSKIANLTISPEAMETNVMLDVTVFKPLPEQGANVSLAESIQETKEVTEIAVNSTDSIPTSTAETEASSGTLAEASSTTTTPKPAPISIINTTSITIITPNTTLKPLIIETNPTILDADPFDANAQPTLPPSLPNLKIIPFLPTDAVKADRNNLPYDYYHAKSPNVKIDYDQYDEGNMYPAITEPHFPIYPDLVDDNKAEYIYKFKVEGPSAPVMSSSVGGGKLDGANGATAAAAAFVKYDFNSAELEHKGFSPPTKTEGGFVPKDPLVLGEDDELHIDALPPYVDASNYQVTKHIIDINTSEPLRANLTKVIEITTPDPFKDVIRTEPPPDLTSLIEDKEKIIAQNPAQQQPIKRFDDVDNLSHTVIHITTAEPQTSQMVHNELTLKTTMRLKDPEEAPPKKEEHKNTISSFLDLLLGDGEPDLIEGLTEVNVTVGATPVPPFKALPEELPQAVVTLIPNLITTTTTAIPKTTATSTTTKRTTTTSPTTTIKASTTTKKPYASTIYANSATSLAALNHKLNATAVGATRFRPKPKTPAGHRYNTTTKIATTTKPKITRPKLSLLRRQTTKIPTVLGTSYKRYNSNKTTTVTTTTTTIAPSVSLTTTTTTLRPQPPTAKPLLRSPFDTLPFMDASFDVKRTTVRPFVVGQHAEVDMLGLMDYKHSSNHFEGLEAAHESFPPSGPTLTPTTTTTTTTSVPLVQRDIEQIISAANVAPQMLDASAAGAVTTTTTSVEVQHSASNSLIDPAGVLKLAGCNIYGRMYRVGRIILELSSPCLECKCTEVGVKCGQLDC
ncbi:mucin-2 [Eurosta solidaginis]|uniref:mucin-2 n=1 Tax=Eurosta solidaginis TaxID=178769 RepID=UPI003530D24D